MDKNERINYQSSRNGFLTAVLLLAVLTVYQLVTQGEYMNETFLVLIFSITVFWGTKFIHRN